MTEIIIPGRYARSNRLRDALSRRDEGTFRNEVALTAAFTAATRRVMDNRKMTNGELLQALLGTLVSAVQAKAPPEEWGMAAEILADELRSKLTVMGDTGEDDHPRRMI